METAIQFATNKLLELPKDKLDDRDHWIVNGVIKGVHCFSKINTIVLKNRFKNFSPSTQELIAQHLSEIIFHCGYMIHLLEEDPSNFDIKSLEIFVQELDESVQNDMILCSLFGINSLHTLLEESFLGANESETEFEGEGEFTDFSLEDSLPEELQDSITNHFAEIFAAVIILCELVDLDIEVVINNVKAVERI